jgi:hypothetical protein
MKKLRIFPYCVIGNTIEDCFYTLQYRLEKYIQFSSNPRCVHYSPTGDPDVRRFSSRCTPSLIMECGLLPLPLTRVTISQV